MIPSEGNTPMTVINSYFERNNASLGGVIFIDTNLPYFSDNNVFKNNTAFYGPVFASYAIRLALKVIEPNEKGNRIIFNSLHQNQTHFTLQKEFPGMNMQKQLNFEALDHFNQTVLTMNQGSKFIFFKILTKILTLPCF